MRINIGQIFAKRFKQHPIVDRQKHRTLYNEKCPALTQLAKLNSEDGEPIEYQAEQLEKCLEHYSKLYT